MVIVTPVKPQAIILAAIRGYEYPREIHSQKEELNF
jgi:hypothetical protein